MTFNGTVLQVIPALDAGGAERTVVEIVAALTAAGGRALVASYGGRLVDEIEAAGGEIFLMPAHSKQPVEMWRNRARLIRLIENEAVDIVHARSRAPAWSALWAARASEKPFVTTYHGAYGAKGALKRLYNSSMVRGDLVIANSAFTAAAIRAQHEIDARRIMVIPRGADLGRFSPANVSEARVSALAAGWGAPKNGALRVLVPGRMTAWKGHETVIEAVRRLAAARAGTGQRLDLQVIFAGDAQGRDDYAKALRDKIDKRGVRDMIKLVGHCADMPAAYAWADAVISPSIRPEAFGRVAVEAGAMARPVIASAHGGACETIIDGDTGVLAPPGDAAAFADAIDGLAAMPPAGRAAMGARARARVEQYFSTDAMCAATLDVYARLAAG